MLDRFSLKAVLILAFLMVPLSTSAQNQNTEANKQTVHMVVWRGCEEACQAFIRYFEDRNLPVKVEVTDVAKDRGKLPDVQSMLIDARPDLVVTWGTSVSRAILGTRADYGAGSAIGNIPALFMIVADPIGSDLVESYERSGRNHVTGVRNRVPEEVQLRLLFEYFRPTRLGVLNHPGEFNSALNTEKLRSLSDEFSFTLIEGLYTPNDNGDVDVNQIPKEMAELKAQGAEAVYVGSSSFNLEHQVEFVAAAADLNLPVFSAYTRMVKEGGALMAIGTSYANVGRLAARQAARILLEDIEPSSLPISALNRYSVIVNMNSAKNLGRFPPLSLISIAEIVK